MKNGLITISKAAEILRVSIDTMRRWDKSGKLPSIRRPGGHRYYNPEDIEYRLSILKTKKQDLFLLAKDWASKKDGSEPEDIFYCSSSAVFQTRIMRLEKELSEIPQLQAIFSLIVAVSGEIGNNSFDHNIGNWPDVPGIFFGYDINKKEIVLADRGQGILTTLKRIKPELKNDEEALYTAFTEIISGRAPESRGNGLKFVKNVVMNNEIKLYFQSGEAEVWIKKGDKIIKVKESYDCIRGCITLIKF